MPRGRRLYVTVGTTRHDALVARVCTESFAAMLRDRGFDRVVMQLGHGDVPDTVLAAARNDAAPSSAADASRAAGGGKSTDARPSPRSSSTASRERRSGGHGGGSGSGSGDDDGTTATNGSTSDDADLSDAAMAMTVRQWGIDFDLYRLKASTAGDVAAADVVLSHGGAGSIFDALRQLKPLVVCINESLMGNHQVELTDALAARGHVVTCTPDTLLAAFEGADFDALAPLPAADVGHITRVLDCETGGTAAGAHAAKGD